MQTRFSTPCGRVLVMCGAARSFTRAHHVQAASPPAASELAKRGRCFNGRCGGRRLSPMLCDEHTVGQKATSYRGVLHPGLWSPSLVKPALSQSSPYRNTEARKAILALPRYRGSLTEISRRMLSLAPYQGLVDPHLPCWPASHR